MADEKTNLCIALTRAGRPCPNVAQPGSTYCSIHQPVSAPAGTIADDPDNRRYLTEELDRLIEELGQTAPNFRPPPFSVPAMMAFVRQQVNQLPPHLRLDTLLRLRQALETDAFDLELWQGVWFMVNYWREQQQKGLTQALARLPIPPAVAQQLKGLFRPEMLDPDTWKGIWFMASYSLKYQAEMVKRRFTGDYETDEWGLDWEFLDTVRPLFSFLYKSYWRVSVSGLEHVPESGRGLIVANHSGQIPFDGLMLMAAILFDHPAQRLVRNLYGDFVPELPFLSSALEKVGQTLASVENGTRLLEQDELVAVYPEGYKGSGKLFKHRYQLASFEPGQFVQMALKSAAPIIPAAIVGAEESYLTLRKSATMAALTGLPYFPISPTFPWLGLLGLAPLPTKWHIDFGPPIATDQYEPEIINEPLFLSQLSNQVRNVVQQLLTERLNQRTSLF